MELKDLKPSALWAHFAEICGIPHPSHHEEKIRAFVVDWARAKGLDVREDEAHNVIVRKPATPGMEGRKGIVLQAHLDMVPQKNNDTRFDFERDAIEAYIDGGLVKARGTTLGADNGIGAAAIMAIMESSELRHGPLEALFTATEETGMEGAFGLQGGELAGEILVNLDSEREGELCTGCAGGTDANISLAYTAEKAPASGFVAARVEVKGLKGGHSGVEIILQRANAGRVLFRTLMPHLAEGVLLASVDSGGLRNAIPREGHAVVLVPEAGFADFERTVAAAERTLQEEYRDIEDGISLSVHRVAEAPGEVLPAKTARDLAALVTVCPDGVVKMSTAMPGLVQTSSNLARIVSDGREVKLHALVRSAARTEKEFVCERIVALCGLVGAECALTGSYDGWNPNMSSPILKAMVASYERMFGEKAEVTAVHAGLECGIIGGKYPGMDMISVGPTIRYPHSPDEQVDIASVEKFWKFLVNTLENAPAK